MSNYIKPVIIIGDIHERWNCLKKTIMDYFICDCYLICVGDLGIGFPDSSQYDVQADLNEFFRDLNIHFISIRGNHDDPAAFRTGSILKWSNFELVADYSIKIINGEKYQFVGGALSVDRSDSHRIEGLTYWSDETFVCRPDLAEQCDVLITHSSPSWNGPSDKNGIASYCVADLTLWDECIQERKDIDRLYEICQPKYHYCGHFHQYYYMTNNGSRSIILAELQPKEHIA